MAAPETNLPATRPSTDGSQGSGPATNRHGSNLNTFQFVSQLVSATPPYLLNMSSPFPGNFFSDLLRRMAPRAGTPGLSLDTTLQQHIRAALLTKSTTPPAMPPLHQPLDLAAIAAQHRQPTIPPPSQEKGIKRSLFSDVSSLSGREEEHSVKRPRFEDREDRRKPGDSLAPSFLLQPPFLPGSVPPPPDVIPSWPGSVSLIRPQMPIPAHVPPPPLDPYRFLLDLRLAGQLRTMTPHMFHHKESQHSSLIAPTAITSRPTPQKDTKPKDEEPNSISVSQNGPLRDEARVSAFHPPGRNSDAQEEENGENRSCSSNSNTSSNCSRDSVGPQYIFRHLNDIYRTIDHQKPEDEEGNSQERDKPKTEPLDPEETDKPKTENGSLSDMAHLVRPTFPLVNGQPEGPSFKANITIKNSDS